MRPAVGMARHRAAAAQHLVEAVRRDDEDGAALTAASGAVELVNGLGDVGDLLLAELLVVRQRQHAVGLPLGDGEVATLVAETRGGRVQVQRSAVVDERLDAALRQERLQLVAASPRFTPSGVIARPFALASSCSLPMWVALPVASASTAPNHSGRVTWRVIFPSLFFRRAPRLAGSGDEPQVGNNFTTTPQVSRDLDVVEFRAMTLQL